MKRLRPALRLAAVLALAGSALSFGPGPAAASPAQSVPAPAKLDFAVKPTPLFVTDGKALMRRVDLEIDNGGPAAAGRIQVTGFPKPVTVPIASVPAGRSTVPVFLPDASATVRGAVELKVGALAAARKVAFEPQRKWTVYLLPHSHTDIGYTDLQSRVAKNHLDYLDSVIEFCKATDGYPEEAKFRWNIEVSWALQNYLRSRPEAKVRELLALLRSGRVELSGLFLQLSDAFGAEELVRAVANPVELSRAHGFPLRAAMNNDVNGFSWGLPQLFAQAGIKYFSTGINETRSRAPLRRPNPFYWQGQDGSKVLEWNGEHYLFSNYELLLHEGYEKSFPKVTDYLAKLGARGDYPYDLIAFHIGGYVTDNCPPKMELSDRVREWNDKWAFPKLRLATMSEFFAALEKKYAKAIPTYKLGWPDYWTDGVASTAFETGVNRAAHAELLSGETWAALAALASKGFVYPSAEIAEGYENTMLYDEHTWGAHNSISEPDSEFARSQWAVKSSFAYTAREIGRTVQARSLQALARNIPAADAWSLAVFNPLSWERSDIVRASLPGAFTGEKKRPFKLVEKRSGAEVSYQIVDGGTLLFQASAVPPLGYAVYSLIPDVQPSPPAPSAVVGPSSIENRYYKIAVDPTSGGLSSVVDKETGEELVDRTAAWTLNQYIYENPAGGRKAVDDMTKRASFERVSPVSAVCAPGLQGPGASSLIIRSKARPCSSIEQEIVLYDGIKRLDIVNRLRKEEVFEPEALYFAFPFGVDGSKARFELAGATMTPETEQLPRTTRDWHTVQTLGRVRGLATERRLVARRGSSCPVRRHQHREMAGEARPQERLRVLLRDEQLLDDELQGGPGRSVHVPVRDHEPERRRRSGRLDPVRVGGRTPPLRSSGSRKRAEDRSIRPASRSSPGQAERHRPGRQGSDRGDGIVLRLREIAGLETRVRISVPGLKSATVTVEATDIAEGMANIAAVVPGSIFADLKPFGLQTIVIRD